MLTLINNKLLSVNDNDNINFLNLLELVSNLFIIHFLGVANRLILKKNII